jgi:hypothetical protein
MAVRVAAGRTGGHQKQASWPSGWPEVGQAAIRVASCRKDMDVREAAGRIYFRPGGRRSDGWPSGWPHVGVRWPSGRPQVGAISVRVAAGRTGGRQGGRRKDRRPSRWPQVGQGGHQGDRR